MKQSNLCLWHASKTLNKSRLMKQNAEKSNTWVANLAYHKLLLLLDMLKLQGYVDKVCSGVRVTLPMSLVQPPSTQCL